MKGLHLLKLTCCIVLITSLKTKAQQQTNGNVGIGTPTPHASAILELASKSQGFLMPRMTLQQRTSIFNPAQGLMVYQTDFLQGVYVFDGKSWNSISGTSTTTTPPTSSTVDGGSTTGTGGEPQPSTDISWSLRGNSGLTSDHFLGTKDEMPLVFKVNGYFSGVIDNQQNNTLFGYKIGVGPKTFNSVVLGAMAMQRATEGKDNVVIGYQSMFTHEKGQFNVAVGSMSLASSTTGGNNTVVGAMAGYRSTGNSNVFLGYQAGYFEEGNNKLYISNSSSQSPLIYGDFEKGFLGINTSKPTTALSIRSNVQHSSGLQFQNLTASSPVFSANTSGKVLSVDSLGNVILVTDGLGQISDMPFSLKWQDQGNDIVNTNTGNLILRKGLFVSEKVTARGVVLGENGIRFDQMNFNTPALNANGKALSLDNYGNVILVKSTIDDNTNKEWLTDGINITNKNSGRVVIQNDLQVQKTLLGEDANFNNVVVNNTFNTNRVKIGAGGITFTQLNSLSKPLEPNGKVLSLDDTGNVILVSSQSNGSGSGTTTPGSSTGSNAGWNFLGDAIVNSNSGNVKVRKDLEVTGINSARGYNVGINGIRFSNINADTPALQPNGKALSLDSYGNVILVSSQGGTTITPGDTTKATSYWKIDGSAIINNNIGKVLVKNDLEVGNTMFTRGIVLGAGGARLATLNSNSFVSQSNGKVLSVDNNGNVILVNDQVGADGSTAPTEADTKWKLTDDRLEMNQNSKLVLGSGITNLPDGYIMYASGGILAERVRVAVPNSEKWADYVFKPSYKLASLKDVENHISQNGYLPGMPSAAAAAKDGMDVLDMSVKLLEKVEELTLYMIEANKQIEDLKKEVAELKANNGGGKEG